MPDVPRLDEMKRRIDDQQRRISELERRLEAAEAANDKFQRWITDHRRQFEPKNSG